jgi:hypothetical protein
VDSSDGSTSKQTLAEQWDGGGWYVISSPTISGANQGPIDNYLYGVAATSAGDIWAAGTTGDPYPPINGAYKTLDQTLVLQYR